MAAVRPETTFNKMVPATSTTKPMSAHLPIAFAFTGLESILTRYKINPTSGKRNDKIFNPVDGISGS